MSLLRDHRVYLSLLGDDRAKDTMRGIVTDLGGAVTTAVSKANVVVFHKGPAASLDIARALSLPVVTADWVYACHASGTVEGYAAFMYTDETPPTANTFEAGYDAKVAIVRGFPPDVTASDIHTFFTTFGNVTNVDFSETTKIAKVTFSDASFVDIIVTMGTTNSLTMDGAVLRIENGVDHENRAQLIKMEGVYMHGEAIHGDVPIGYVFPLQLSQSEATFRQPRDTFEVGYDAYMHGNVPIGSPSQLSQSEATFRQLGSPSDKRASTKNHQPMQIDRSKVVFVHGFPPAATAFDIYTYFSSFLNFRNVTNVDFSETTKIAKVTFSETCFADVMVTMGTTNSLTMDGAVLNVENGVDHENRAQQIKMEGVYMHGEAIHGDVPIGYVLPSQVPQTEATFQRPRGTDKKSKKTPQNVCRICLKECSSSNSLISHTAAKHGGPAKARVVWTGGTSRAANPQGITQKAQIPKTRTQSDAVLPVSQEVVSGHGSSPDADWQTHAADMWVMRALRRRKSGNPPLTARAFYCEVNNWKSHKFPNGVSAQQYCKAVHRLLKESHLLVFNDGCYLASVQGAQVPIEVPPESKESKKQRKAIENADNKKAAIDNKRQTHPELFHYCATCQCHMPNCEIASHNKSKKHKTQEDAADKKNATLVPTGLPALTLPLLRPTRSRSRSPRPRNSPKKRQSDRSDSRDPKRRHHRRSSRSSSTSSSGSSSTSRSRSKFRSMRRR